MMHLLKHLQKIKTLQLFFIHHKFYNSLSSLTFPTLKYAAVKPVFKKDDEMDKENYR